MHKSLSGILILLSCAILAGQPASILKAQESIDISTDTTGRESEVIPLAEISARSGQVIIANKKVLDALISGEEITARKQLNDSLFLSLDSLLVEEQKYDFENENLRYLRNRLVYWQRVLGIIENRKSKLSDMVGDLDNDKYELEEQTGIWENTRQKLVEEEHTSSVFTRIDGVIANLDSSRTIVLNKSDQLLAILDKATNKGLAVEELIDDIEESIAARQEKMFAAHIDPIWKADFKNPRNRSISAPLKQLYDLEVKGLYSYLQTHLSNLIIQLILLLGLILLFLWVKRRMANLDIRESSSYQHMLKKILSHPVNAGLILGLFASVIIFPNRPLLLRDLSKVIIVIPLVILTATVTARKYDKYLYFLGAMIILQTVYFFFPPGHLLYWASLLTIAIVQFVLLYQLFNYITRSEEQPSGRKGVLKFVVLLHMAFSVIGAFALIFGANILAEIAVNVTLINAFGGILLMISALIINGLIEVGIESKFATRLNVFRLYRRHVENRLATLVNLGAVIFWFFIMLNVMRIDLVVRDSISQFLSGEISIGSASFTLAGILTFFLVIWLSIVVANILRAILEEDVLKHMRLAKGLPHTISVMVRYTLITIGLLLAVSAAGMPLDSLTILFGAFGVGIGFGLQNIFNNLVSGLILLFERPIQIGDTIEVGQLMGNVKSIGIRSSNVRTFDGAEVIVPNGLLISNEVVNWTLSDQTRRIEVIAGVAYGSDPHKVKELFEHVLSDHPDIIKEPPPKVFFQELGDSSLNFRLLFWTSNFSEWIRIRSDIIFGVHDILKKEGIEIPFPQRDLHIRSIEQQVEIASKGGKESKKGE